MLNSRPKPLSAPRLSRLDFLRAMAAGCAAMGLPSVGRAQATDDQKKRKVLFIAVDDPGGQTAGLHEPGRARQVSSLSKGSSPASLRNMDH